MSDAKNPQPDLTRIIADMAMRSFASMLFELPAKLRAAALARMEVELPEVYEQVKRHVAAREEEAIAAAEERRLLADKALDGLAASMLNMTEVQRAELLSRAKMESPATYAKLTARLKQAWSCSVGERFEEAIAAEEVLPRTAPPDPSRYSWIAALPFPGVARDLGESVAKKVGIPCISTLTPNSQGKLGTPELLFLDCTFRLGLNVTVRDGRKWDAIAERLPQPIVIKPTAHADLTSGHRGKIIGKLVCKAKDIPDFALALEHAATCRTTEGLYAGMKAAYGESWTPENEVTVLFFTLDD